jgi:TetR/AcrR family transcriptional regulator, transcriptional repressor for nem operon
MAAMAQRQADRTDTATQILDVAERLVQVRGFNAFSYADVAGELGLTNAALHYHFASKSELGEALIARYTERFAGALEEIDQSLTDSPHKLAAYIDLYADVLRRKRMCLCGMLAAEYETLSEEMQNAVVLFFQMNEKWLSRVLNDGREQGSVKYEGSSLDEARAIVSSLEGAVLVARSFGNIGRFKSVANRLLAALGT